MDQDPLPLHKLKEHRDAVAAWIATSAYAANQAANAAQLTSVEQNILMLPPDKPEAIALLLDLHGQRKVLIACATHFEDVLDDLNKRILALEDRKPN